LTPVFFLILLGAYLLGSVPTAYLVARWRRGIDLRRFGSGNVGLSNVLASGSRWSSVIVIVFDLFKGMAPVYVAKVADLQLGQQIIIGLAAICGHNWTVFLKFNGGRGILTALGVIFALQPWLALTMLVVAIAWLPFKQFALGTLLALVMLPPTSWFVTGLLVGDRSVTLTAGFLALTVLAVLRRLTASRTEFWRGQPLSSILWCRLLYDRDIRDRETWLKRQPSRMSPAA
jgi:glycerol-3-phosphate acyltransferase PlsY